MQELQNVLTEGFSRHREARAMKIIILCIILGKVETHPGAGREKKKNYSQNEGDEKINQFQRGN